MPPFLKNHPFAVEAFFEKSLVLTFAVPKQAIASLVPPCLALETFDDRWAFIAVAMVQTRNLKPKGFPKIFGNDFFLIGYRIFVRYLNNAGKRLRGLYILQSETDKKEMQFLGNIFTHYNYAFTDIRQQLENNRLTISSRHSGFSVTIDTGTQDDVPLPAGSPFANWKEARRYAGPLPFTFTYLPATKQVLIVEGVRENWTPTPVHVINHQIPYISHFNNIQLANAFAIDNIPYHWKKGKIELWKPA